MSTEPSQIFLSYAREDEKTAQRLYRDLSNLGYRVWLDSERLKAGSDWKATIRSEIRNSSLFLALISGASLDKRGFVQAELREALEVLLEFPSGGIFVVPVRLDNCEPKDSRLSQLHWVDLFPSYFPGLQRLIQNLPEEVRPSEEDRPQPAGGLTDERAAILREFTELANRVAQDAVGLLSLSKQPGQASKILAAPIHQRVAEYQPRVQELLQQIGLLCSESTSKAAGPIAVVALILKMASLNPKAIELAQPDIEKLPTEHLPALQIAARQELGLLSSEK